MHKIMIDEMTDGIDEEGEYRIETGGVQFDDDWPGFFMRGDDALYVASLISMLDVIGQAEGDRTLAIQQLKIYADQIFQEVPYRQWIDEDHHSIIEPVPGGKSVSVSRDGKIEQVDKHWDRVVEVPDDTEG